MKHVDKINNLLDTVVKITRSNGDHHRIAVDQLIVTILGNNEETLKAAALCGQTQAYIFVYAFGSTYKDIPIYNYLFPNDKLREKLVELKLDSVFMQIKKYFEPFEVEHKVFQIITPKKTEKDQVRIHEVDMINSQLFSDGTLAGDKYIGAIVVSWDKFV